jgi:hypothetical protein
MVCPNVLGGSIGAAELASAGPSTSRGMALAALKALTASRNWRRESPGTGSSGVGYPERSAQPMGGSTSSVRVADATGRPDWEAVITR